MVVVVVVVVGRWLLVVGCWFDDVCTDVRYVVLQYVRDGSATCYGTVRYVCPPVNTPTLGPRTGPRTLGFIFLVIFWERFIESSRGFNTAGFRDCQTRGES